MNMKLFLLRIHYIIHIHNFYYISIICHFQNIYTRNQYISFKSFLSTFMYNLDMFYNYIIHLSLIKYILKRYY